jgi:hypothetical protein
MYKGYYGSRVSCRGKGKKKNWKVKRFKVYCRYFRIVMKPIKCCLKGGRGGRLREYDKGVGDLI